MTTSSEGQAGYVRHEEQESRMKCIFDRRAACTNFFIAARESCKRWL